MLQNKNAPLKIVATIIGSGAVGKSSFITRFLTGQFPEEYVPSVCSVDDVLFKVGKAYGTLTIHDTANSKDCKLQLFF